MVYYRSGGPVSGGYCIRAEAGDVVGTVNVDGSRSWPLRGNVPGAPVAFSVWKAGDGSA